MQDGITKLREQRTGTVGENTTEESNVTVGIIRAIQDVNPLELTAIILRIEVHAVSRSHRSRHNRTEHILMEDVAQFIVSRLVVGVHLVLDTLGRQLTNEGVHTDELILVITAGHVIDTEPRGIRINRVVEATVTAFDPEGSEQIVGLGPPEVLTDVSIQPDEGFAGFGTADEHEHRRTVFTAHGVASCAVADELHVEALEDTLGQLAGRQSGGRNRARSSRSSDTGDNRIINRTRVSSTRGRGNK